MKHIGLVLVFVLACGSGSGGAGTPEQVVRAMVDAVQRGDGAAIKRVLVRPGRLRQALSCADGDNPITTLERALDALAELDRSTDALKGVTVEVRSVAETGHRAVAKGELYRGCTATEPFEVRMLAVDKRISQAGETNDAEATMDVIRFDGAWYLMADQ